MKFWLNDTQELTNSLTIIPNKDMNNTEYYNTLTRICIIICTILFIVFRNKMILIFGAAIILIIIVRYKENENIIENMKNYNKEYDDSELITYPKNNLYNSDLLYDKRDIKCNYEISDRNNEINNPINININYYKYYNSRNNICQKNDFKKYNQYLDFLYPNRKVRYCKEGFQTDCFKVDHNYTPNHIKYHLN